MSWQPIETAPRDGTVFIAWRFYAIAARWIGDAGGDYPWQLCMLGSPTFPMQDNGLTEDDLNMSHWMPLPEVPE